MGNYSQVTQESAMRSLFSRLLGGGSADTVTISAAEKPRHHQARVVRITDIQKHGNANSLGLVQIEGYQVVVKLGEFQPGDLAVYVQPDSVVPERPEYSFIWGDRKFFIEGTTKPAPVPEKYRRVTARRFRGEWSEGLLLKIIYSPYREEEVSGIHIRHHGLSAVIDYKTNQPVRVDEGEDVSDLLGITHYQPPEPGERINLHNYDKGVWPKSLKGWFYFILRKLGFDVNGATGGDNERAPKSYPPVYDVQAYKNYRGAFQPGEEVVVTEKIHGSNFRAVFEGGKMYVGSRQLWKSPKSKCIWRAALRANPTIEEWCREYPGHTIYGEVVPSQKFKDGKVVNYGVQPGDQPKVFFFDILNPDGTWGNFWDVKPASEYPGKNVFFLSTAPVLYKGPFDEEVIKKLVDGKTCVPGAAGSHIREGVVISPLHERHVPGLGRLKLKIVSNQFLTET